MLPNPDTADTHDEEQHEEGPDMVGIYRAILRAIAHLDERDYTEQDSRQADVLQHLDLPDPASGVDNSQG